MLNVIAKLERLKETEYPVDRGTVSEESDNADDDEEEESGDYESNTQETNSNSSNDKDSGFDELSADNESNGSLCSGTLSVEEEEELYNMIRSILEKCLSHEVGRGRG